MRTLTSYGNYTDGLNLTRSDVEKCSHSGDCESDVIEVLNKPYVRKQFKSLNPEKIAKELRDYGAWDDNQLSDTTQNQIRFVWVMAGQIFDEL